jgi:thiol-disulfide isomerase/thioredoxin
MTAPKKSPPSSGNSKALIGLLLAGSIGIIIFLFVQLSSSKGPSIGTKTAAAACKKGEQCLPDVSYVDTNGTAYTKQSLAGKVVVINFWATWCKPCLKEIPDLSRAYEKYKGKGLVVLGVLASDNPDNGTLLNFQSDNEMTFPVVRATSDILVSYDYPANLPTTFIFDRTGHQAHTHVGALSTEKLTAILEPLLAAN